MSLHDENIRRWLNEADADAAPRLDRARPDGEHGSDANDEAETEFLREVARLKLVQGLLSTLDLKSAPKELDSLIEEDWGNTGSAEAGDLSEKDMSVWFEGLGSEPILEPRKAPEFLDRIVEQRLEALRDSAKSASMGAQGLGGEEATALSRNGLARTSRRLLAGAGFALALLVAPLVFSGYFSGDFSASQGMAQPSPRLVNFDSLEGLQRAFPSQSQAANGLGMLGAFGGHSQDEGGPR